MSLTSLGRMTVVASLTALCGCYVSSEPLGKPGKGPLDSRLSGNWHCRSPETEKPSEASLLVIPFGGSQYYAEWHEGDDVSRYRAYSTTDRGEPLLNVEELGRQANLGGWVFMRYRFAPDDSLRLFVVSEGALGELKGKAALNAIARRATDDTLYEALATCTHENS